MDFTKILDFYASFTDPDNSLISMKFKFIPFHLLINFHKGSTIIVYLILIWYFQNFSTGAWIYTALHGSYGLIWILKDLVIPDKTFRVKVDIISATITWVVLVSYWYFGFLMIARYAQQNPSEVRIFSCLLMYIFGLVFMICTDIQKNIVLKFKKGLIDNYFLAWNRNTNYLGEIMIYLSFAILVNERFPYLFLLFVWLTLFFGRIYLKEKSLMKKEGYENYKRNSYLILFKFFKSEILNIGFYFLIAIMTIFLYFKSN